jgi:SET domain-containing protein
MNIVKTYIDKSPVNGTGLFAAEFIPKGTLIWELQDHFDTVIKEDDFKFITGPTSTMSKVQKEYLFKYCYFKNGKRVLCADDAKFANHSLNANTISTFDKQYAKVDIQIGEEIFCDYREICDDFDENNL